eukprot:4524069-Amphidinium_carterae.1
MKTSTCSQYFMIQTCQGTSVECQDVRLCPRFVCRGEWLYDAVSGVGGSVTLSSDEVVTSEQSAAIWHAAEMADTRLGL